MEVTREGTWKLNKVALNEISIHGCQRVFARRRRGSFKEVLNVVTAWVVSAWNNNSQKNSNFLDFVSVHRFHFYFTSIEHPS